MTKQRKKRNKTKEKAGYSSHVIGVPNQNRTEIDTFTVI